MRQCPASVTSTTRACAAWRTYRSSAQRAGCLKLREHRTQTCCPQTHKVRGGRHRSRLLTQLAAADIAWSSASVESNEKVGKDRYKLVLDIGEDVAKGYTVPGQYVQLRCGEEQKPAFIAIANAPSESSLVEIVVKTNDGTAGAICALGKGEELDVSPVMGKGFAVEDKAPLSTCKNVYLVATGTGIAPIRALIQSGDLEIPSRESVALYYGYRNQDYCAYSEEFPEWEKLGVKVIPVLSEPGSDWQGDSGYVQDTFKANEKLEEPQGVVAIIAGQYELAGVFSEMFKEAAVPEERVILNF
ncbi:putative FAD/NAD(P)-binding oxidoreductase [Chloropicon primus]|uniref:Putative FAD/NAD(P)-binding oxidoreductase n=1 Tax=Chloropicon primus TaxID=1764295 RepID=A0A5B8MCC5_9CHLO|nr:putative FAD/NAD(P)-binding oxidoreductase [Chloropicon primus]UPQ97370.1 putative FAD/NAD(P)-binding oxidoreductase [Chloropicon primus]|eukprot:QDZ18158.1 putative FAD/NAD(P)-binding oxidoreductase [Chloropicon primus]